MCQICNQFSPRFTIIKSNGDSKAHCKLLHHPFGVSMYSLCGCLQLCTIKHFCLTNGYVRNVDPWLVGCCCFIVRFMWCFCMDQWVLHISWPMDGLYICLQCGQRGNACNPSPPIQMLQLVVVPQKLILVCTILGRKCVVWLGHVGGLGHGGQQDLFKLWCCAQVSARIFQGCL